MEDFGPISEELSIKMQQKVLELTGHDDQIDVYRSNTVMLSLGTMRAILAKLERLETEAKQSFKL